MARYQILEKDWIFGLGFPNCILSPANKDFLQDVLLQSHPDTFLRNLIRKHLPFALVLSHLTGNSKNNNQIREANKGNQMKELWWTTLG